MPKRFTKSASVVCPGRIWLTFSCVIVLGYEARIVRQEESRRAATRDLVFIWAGLYILHKLRRDAAKSFASRRDLFAFAICDDEGLAFVQSWPTDPSPAEKRNCSDWSAPVCERW